MTSVQASPRPISPDMTQTVFDADFWREFAPNFSIGSKIGNYAFDVSEKDKQDHNKKLVREGYVHVRAPGLDAPFPEMAKIFTAIVDKGLPPVFAFVYDELWMLNTQIRNLIKSLLHDEYMQLPDFWAWRVAPGQAGWRPHRDKGAYSLFPDKTPKSLTVWMPVTQAHPLNGCMYVLPADRDTLYGVDGANGFGGQLQDFRALPADPGDVLAWTQHVWHWGGHSADEHHLPPRMSVAFEYQRSDIEAYNKPLLDPGAMPDFDRRLALIAQQVMQYRHMYGFTPELVAIAESIIARFGLPRQTG